MGFASKYIATDEATYRHYSCGVCKQLVDIDCMVTRACSHVACRKCLLKHMMTSSCCPTCKAAFCVPVQPEPKPGKKTKRSTKKDTVFVVPLHKRQPLAHRVLKSLQVRCPLQSLQCKWSGCYEDLRGHLLCPNAHSTPVNSPRGRSRTPVRSNCGSGQAPVIFANVKKALPEDISETETSESGSESSWDEQLPPLRPIAKKVEVRAPSSASVSTYLPKLLQIVETYKEEGNSHFTQQRYAQAISMYTRSLDLLANRAPANNQDAKSLKVKLLCNRAACQFMQQNYQTSVADAQEALNIDPTYEKASLRMARAFLHLGNFEEAVKVMETMCARTPAPSDTLQQFSKKCKTLNQAYLDALTFLESAQHEMATTKVATLLAEISAPSVVLMAAQASMGSGNTDEASAFCSRVLASDPKNTKAMFLRGEAEILAGNAEEGLKFLKQGFGQDPGSVSSAFAVRRWVPIGKFVQEVEVHLSKEDWVECLRSLDKAIQGCPMLPRKSPLYSKLHLARARSYKAMGNHEASLKDCAAVISHHGEHTDAWLLRLSVLHELGRHAEVLKDVRTIQSTWGCDDERFAKVLRKAEQAVKARGDLYEILGVSKGASQSDMRKAFRMRSRQCHPDRFMHGTEKQLQEAATEFQALNEALEVLTDDFMRKLYDEGHTMRVIRQRALKRSSLN